MPETLSMDNANTNPLLPKRSLLGFYTHPGTMEEYLQLLKTSVEKRVPCTIFYHNLHSLYTYFSSEKLRQYYNGSTVLVDGMPVVWLYKLFGVPLTRDHRITYVDFIIPVMQAASDNNWKVFHIGQSEEIIDKAFSAIREQVPDVQLGSHHGYFDKEPQCSESLEVIKAANDFGANIIFVGFGTPVQEAWLHEHRDQLDAQIVFIAGACMEYFAGTVRTPPRWMGRVGLEWSFRLIENPRRFAFRYLVEPVLLMFMLARNWVGARVGGSSNS